MANKQHAALTTTDLHEPKGAAAAAAGSVYVADGAGSGAWTAGCDYVTLAVELTDISTASSAYTISPVAGTVIKVHSVIHGAIATSDSTLTAKINGVSITDGIITVAYSGSAAGDVDTVTPTAARTVAGGDLITVTTSGASTNTIRATILLVVEVS